MRFDLNIISLDVNLKKSKYAAPQKLYRIVERRSTKPYQISWKISTQNPTASPINWGKQFHNQKSK